MALGDGAWTPYPRTLSPDLYPWTLDPFSHTPPNARARLVRLGRDPPPHIGKSHVLRMSVAKRLLL
jgi:hypothetical protein